MVINPINPNRGAGLQYTNADSCKAKLANLGGHRSIPICDAIADINVLAGEIKAVIDQLAVLIHQKQKEKQDVITQMKVLSDQGTLDSEKFNQLNTMFQQKNEEIANLQTQINTFNDLIQNTLGMSKHTMEDFNRMLSALLFQTPDLQPGMKEVLDKGSPTQVAAWFNADPNRRPYIVSYLAQVPLSRILQVMRALGSITEGGEWMVPPVEQFLNNKQDLEDLKDEANKRLGELFAAAETNPGFGNIPAVREYVKEIQKLMDDADKALGGQ